MPLAGDGVRVIPDEVAGFNASKMAAHGLAVAIVADPGPVEPAVAFGAHAPATVPRVFEMLPYISLRTRLPGGPVKHPVIVLGSTEAANINTAALAETVVTAVTFEGAPFELLKL